MPGEPVLLTHPSSLDHDPGPHPEQAARLVAIERELAALDDLGYLRLESPAAERSALARVHTEAHLDRLDALDARGGGAIDADTSMSAGSLDAARHGAGGALRLAELLLYGEARTGFSIHRPPGHHATADRAMGFCLLNNVAVAARHATETLRCPRVLIFDWDVHHGNGTNDIFHSDPRVLFVSIHQSPLYPGSGPASDVGSGAGSGFTVNLPVPPGAGDAEFAALTDRVVVPLLRAFSPGLVLISAGYDAHTEDPLADCRVSDAGFAAMAGLVRDAAQEESAPVGAVLEGGYAPAALARSVAVTMDVLAGSEYQAAPESGTGDALVAAALGRLRRWWAL